MYITRFVDSWLSWSKSCDFSTQIFHLLFDVIAKLLSKLIGTYADDNWWLIWSNLFNLLSEFIFLLPHEQVDKHIKQIIYLIICDKQMETILRYIPSSFVLLILWHFHKNKVGRYLLQKHVIRELVTLSTLSFSNTSQIPIYPLNMYLTISQIIIICGLQSWGNPWIGAVEYP